MAGQHFLLCVPTDPVTHCLFSYYWKAGPVKALPLMRDLAVVGGSVLGLPRTIKIISSRLFLITNPTNYYLKKEKSNWFHERAQNERSFLLYYKMGPQPENLFRFKPQILGWNGVGYIQVIWPKISTEYPKYRQNTASRGTRYNFLTPLPLPPVLGVFLSKMTFTPPHANPKYEV